jgi:hypothetical protein
MFKPGSYEHDVGVRGPLTTGDEAQAIISGEAPSSVRLDGPVAILELVMA